MNILCVIPARKGSKRVPGKNIRLLAGKPLITHTIEKALESNLCNKVVVSTDCSKIADVAEKSGAEVIIRPPSLSLDTSPIDDALRHAIRFYKERKDFVTDIVVLLQANVPIRKKGEIDKVIKKLLEINDVTSVATCYIVDQRPEWMKLVDTKTGLIKPFMTPTDSYRKQDLPKLYLIDGAVLAIKTKTLMETEGTKRSHAFLGNKIGPIIHDTKYSVEIDEEKDFKLAEYFLQKEQNKQKETP